MKKAISMILALVLVLSMSITAFAAEVPDGGTQSITATYSEVESTIVYKVDISWGGMVFNYNSGMENVWNPDTLKFETVQKDEASWAPAAQGGDTVTVTNHSNTGLLVTVTYTPDADNGVTGSVENNSFLLATAEGTATDNAPKGSATLALDNTSVPASWSTEGATTIGNITVKLDHCATASTAEGFEAALANGGTIMLTADIALTPSVDVTKDTTIVLNGCTLALSDSYLYVKNGCTLTVTGNGAVNGDAFNGEGLNVFGGTLNLQGGTVESLLVDIGSTADISGGEVMYLEVWDGTADVSGGYVGDILLGYDGTLIVSGGTFGFDPTNWLAEGYTATETDGIWTVTAN